ncbi:WD40-repeat-containing domain protein [Lipomyces arxii]|uniref:WD40-repeat-containing domain protein n=1 Tax=Lipomyces arxii TaxID=56418 RepID=UPI0034CFD9A7
MGFLSGFQLPTVHLGSFIPTFSIFEGLQDNEDSKSVRSGVSNSSFIRHIPGAYADSADEHSVQELAVAYDDTPPTSPFLSQGSGLQDSHNPNNTGMTDPLSMHILRRTGTDQILTRRMTGVSINEQLESGSSRPILGRRQSSLKSAEALSEIQPMSQLNDAERLESATNISQNGAKKKKVSFLARVTGRKAKTESDSDDAAPTIADGRPRRQEGNNVAVYSQPIGYVPQNPEAPKYIRTRTHGKFSKDFDRLFLAQELYRKPAGETGESIAHANTSSVSLSPTTHKRGAIWSLKFSRDGKYLATGGEDRVVRVWAVIASPAERAQYEKAEDEAEETPIPDNMSQHEHMHRSRANTRSTRSQRVNAPVFHSTPYREFVGHTDDILDTSWSKNGFLLSSSMDKTVRLWHISRDDCLCCFQHQDVVASIAFHPLDDRYFLSGSLDKRLRLWSIPDRKVEYYADMQAYITAVAFSENGQLAIAGSFSGVCSFFDTEELRCRTWMVVRSSHGRNSKGSKITGIEVLPRAPGSLSSDAILLITSNDSRVRFYNMRDKSLESKLKGYENLCSQISASASEDGHYVISGSEDHKVYIWDMSSSKQSKNKDKHPYEVFTASSGKVTSAVFAPSKTIQLLSQTFDPIYDRCTPPPVRLVPPGDMEAKYAPNPPTAHPNGNIIVTSDLTGRIKIFRQDCAYEKRKLFDEKVLSAMAKVVSTSGSSTPATPGTPASTAVLRGGSFDGRQSRSTTPSRSSSHNRLMLRAPSIKRTSRSLSRLSRLSHDLQPLSPMTSKSPGSVAPMQDPVTDAVPHWPSMDSTAVANETSDDALHITPSVSPTTSKMMSRTFSHGFFTDDEDEDEDEINAGGEVQCPKCGGENFKASITVRRETKLVCVNCGTVLK